MFCFILSPRNILSLLQVMTGRQSGRLQFFVCPLVATALFCDKRLAQARLHPRL
jgi:hypothetical protein